eukprot:scaffold45426_cov63-Phaeocystis_antarctica.AAC.2
MHLGAAARPCAHRGVSSSMLRQGKSPTHSPPRRPRRPGVQGEGCSVSCRRAPRWPPSRSSSGIRDNNSP